jgi:hypothetical protein
MCLAVYHRPSYFYVLFISLLIATYSRSLILLPISLPYLSAKPYLTPFHYFYLYSFLRHTHQYTSFLGPCR